MTSPVKLSRERWEMLCRYKKPDADPLYVTKPITIVSPIGIGDITFLPAEYVPGEREISAGEQSAIRAHEYLYGMPQRLGG